MPQEIQARMADIQKAKNIDLPFKNIELEYMPGAKEFLEQHRKPNTRLLLISNKRDHDLHNEVNKLAIAHYFDHISGVETTYENGNVKTRLGKPNPTRLMNALDKQALTHRPLQMRLTGDQIQDLTQGEPLLRDPKKQASGHLIAPNPPKNLTTAIEKGIPVQYTTSFVHIEQTPENVQTQQ